MKDINVKNNTFTNPNNKENFNRYISEIGKIEPLTREEEVELFKKIRLGDRAAYEKICKQNLLFVISIANKIHSSQAGTNITLEDLIGEGNIGLQVAVNKYDPSRGFKFISCAVWWIRQQINVFVDNHKKNIRVSQPSLKIINKFRKTESFLEQKLSRSPSTFETFEQMLENEDINAIYSVDRLFDLMNVNLVEKSLSSFLGDDETTDLSQMIKSHYKTPEEELIDKERINNLMLMLAKRPENESRFLMDYYGIETGKSMSIKEIAEKYDISHSLASSRIEIYLRRLRANNRDKSTYFFPTPDYDFVTRNKNN